MWYFSNAIYNWQLVSVIKISNKAREISLYFGENCYNTLYSSLCTRLIMMVLIYVRRWFTASTSKSISTGYDVDHRSRSWYTLSNSFRRNLHVRFFLSFPERHGVNSRHCESYFLPWYDGFLRYFINLPCQASKLKWIGVLLRALILTCTIVEFIRDFRKS